MFSFDWIFSTQLLQFMFSVVIWRFEEILGVVAGKIIFVQIGFVVLLQLLVATVSHESAFQSAAALVRCGETPSYF